MPDVPITIAPMLEVVSPDASHRSVQLDQSPFAIGRGSEIGNQLQLDDPLISRQCAAIVSERGRYRLADRGNRHGVFINNKKIEAQILEDADVITFGLEDSYKIIFRFAPPDEFIQNMLT